MKHTPVPYCASPTAGHATHGQTAIYSEADGKTIALVYDGQANAAFIVKACNNHERLVEALRDCAERLEKVDQIALEALGQPKECEVSEVTTARSILKELEAE